MSTQKLFGLSSIPSELKPIVPYLQRADEVKTVEPIIAYWCAYYAAQTGLSSLKVGDSASRDVISNLINVLEDMKKQIGNVDAMKTEYAGAAYVENFALRVFQIADDEDRRGVATRSTARKFLAASNFLEVLNSFPKTDVSESNDDKIRYAKWKAADIAKALREGRKPAPGPANQEMNQESSEVQVQGVDTEQSSLSPQPPQTGHPDQFQFQPFPPVVPRDFVYEPLPENLSAHRREGSEASARSGLPGFTSADGSARMPSSSSPSGPGVIRLLNELNEEGNPQSKLEIPSPPDIDIHSSPMLPANEVYPSQVTEGAASTSTPSISQPPPHIPAYPTSYSPTPNTQVSPNQSSYVQSPFPEISRPNPPVVPAPPPPAVVPIPLPRSASVELNYEVIAKIQKHCRFAISSLDYEDGEQAKKELRAALALLGP